MLQLLVDPSPEVRCSAVAGICRVLSIFWLMVPETFLSQSTGVLTRQLAYDASSAKVRASVLRGLRSLVATCDRSHLFLKTLLPRVSDSIHDVNENVRIAVVEMLAAVKHVRTIHYWEVLYCRRALSGSLS